jgi:hypothetical protein
MSSEDGKHPDKKAKTATNVRDSSRRPDGDKALPPSFDGASIPGYSGTTEQVALMDDDASLPPSFEGTALPQPPQTRGRRREPADPDVSLSPSFEGRSKPGHGSAGKKHMMPDSDAALPPSFDGTSLSQPPHVRGRHDALLDEDAQLPPSVSFMAEPLGGNPAGIMHAAKAHLPHGASASAALRHDHVPPKKPQPAEKSTVKPW